MLAFFGNLDPAELVVVVIVAILVFGRELPTVALRGFAQLRKLRRSLEDLRRETGIDRELRNIERELHQASFDASRKKPRLAAPEERRWERAPGPDATPVDATEVEPEPADPAETSSAQNEPEQGPAEEVRRESGS